MVACILHVHVVGLYIVSNTFACHDLLQYGLEPGGTIRFRIQFKKQWGGKASYFPFVFVFNFCFVLAFVILQVRCQVYFPLWFLSFMM